MSRDSGSGNAHIGVLLPVSDSPTLDDTVEYAVRQSRELAAETERDVELVLVASSLTWTDSATPIDRSPERLLSRARSIAESALETLETDDVTVGTALLEQDRYPFDPVAFVDSLVEYANDSGATTVFVDPGYRFPFETTILPSLEDELREVETLDVEVAPVERPARHQRLVTRGGFAHFLALFGASFGFYLLIGGLAEPVFDVVTGAAAAVLVAAVLSRITFEVPPRPRRLLSVAGRFVLYAPYLLWQIAVANVAIAYVILHPSLPIDPSVQRFRPGVWGGTATATLANSITLTPGTLTVDVADGEFVVHSLTRNAREELLDGSLERAVRFVFYGRTAMRYASPRERLGLGEGDST